MKHQVLTFDDCLALAKEFLTTKERSNYNLFAALDDNNNSHYYCYNELSADDVARLRALKDKYGDTFVKHLDEVFDDPDLIHDFTGGREILDIDLDNVYCHYDISLHELRPDGTVDTIHTSVAFSDEDYARLIAWHLYDEHLVINTLRYRDRELYDTVLDGADLYHFNSDGGSYDVYDPNLVTLDEPTTDIDVNTMRALEEGLENFAGCAVVISHDRWFLDRICTHILAFEGDSQVYFFEGGYTEYEENRKKRLGDDTPHRIHYKKLKA